MFVRLGSAEGKGWGQYPVCEHEGTDDQDKTIGRALIFFLPSPNKEILQLLLLLGITSIILMYSAIAMDVKYTRVIRFLC